MRSIFTSRWAKASAAATIAALGLVATTTAAEAGYCAQWRYGRCVDWRANGYYSNYNNGYNNGNPAWALNAFSSVLGAAAAASQPRYYYPPQPTYYYPQPAYYPPPAYGYYGPSVW